MKSSRLILIAVSFATFATALSAQTLYVPSGTSGIGSSSSNVGIGTSSPGSYLPGVVGATIYGNYPALSLSGSESGGNFFLLYENAGSFRVYANNGTADRFMIDATGNVGIGTTNPTQKLDLVGTLRIQAGGLFLDNDQAIRAGGGNQSLIYRSSSNGIYLGSGDTNDFLVLNSGGQEKARITTNGNVGIGTAGPEAGNKLDVYTEGADPSTQIQIRANRASYGNIRGTLKTYAGGSAATDSFKISVDTGSIVLDSGGSTDQFILTHAGNVGIGTTSPGTYKLAVVGKIRAQEVVVDTGWSDYVFKPDYQLASLSEVEAHIKAHGHLPGVPSEAQIAKEGVTLGDMQSKLLAKIEELTLHVIAQEKRAVAQQNEIAALRVQLGTVSKK